jgi:hypothetical protein
MCAIRTVIVALTMVVSSPWQICDIVRRSQGSFNDPTPRRNFEAVGAIGSLDDFEHPFFQLL